MRFSTVRPGDLVITVGMENIGRMALKTRVDGVSKIHIRWLVLWDKNSPEREKITYDADYYFDDNANWLRLIREGNEIL